ncbi:hypothetical protein CCANI_12635 [Corynebacterium canis]|nr:hypothetical protein CCANI_12635 [Corynebacterium canis]
MMKITQNPGFVCKKLHVLHTTHPHRGYQVDYVLFGVALAGGLLRCAPS